MIQFPNRLHFFNQNDHRHEQHRSTRKNLKRTGQAVYQHLSGISYDLTNTVFIQCAEFFLNKCINGSIFQAEIIIDAMAQPCCLPFKGLFDYLAIDRKILKKQTTLPTDLPDNIS